MSRPHLRDVRVDALPGHLREAGVQSTDVLTLRLVSGVHRLGVLDWDGLGLGRKYRRLLTEYFRFGPQLEPAGVRESAEDGARKYAYRLSTGEIIETVLVRNRSKHTLCVSSQAGCALGCTFCATGRMGLRRNLTAGEIQESIARTQMQAGARATDIVFMGMGEPLHNYDAVMDTCHNVNRSEGLCIGKKRISVSTAGLVRGIQRFTAEAQRWRLYLSLHSAIPETRARLMPIERTNPLDAVLDAMREYQTRLSVPWVTLQYVLIPGVNMDDAHVAALGERLAGLRYILNVIPWNDTGAGFRAPTWAEVKDFTNRLRPLRCPVKIRYSAGKKEGMGCGQLSAETLSPVTTGGHMTAPPGVFTR